MGYLAKAMEKAVLGFFGQKLEGKAERPNYPSNDSHQEIELEKAQQIVNEFGVALEKAGYLNSVKVMGLLNDLEAGRESISDVSSDLRKGHGKYHDLFTMKCESSLLPYPKETIQRAIDLLLQYETDPQNVMLLKKGLDYLEYFSR